MAIIGVNEPIRCAIGCIIIGYNSTMDRRWWHFLLPMARIPIRFDPFTQINLKSCLLKCWC
jgi:hypothetical protein